MAKRKNSHGAPVKLSDNQIQQIIKYLIKENDCSLPLHLNPSIITAARLYNVTVKMLVDLITGTGRFKVLFHTTEHKELVEFFKRKNCDENHKSTIVKKRTRVSSNILTSDEDIKKLIELKKTMSSHEIAKMFNCSYITINRRLKPYQVQIASEKKERQISSDKVIEKKERKKRSNKITDQIKKKIIQLSKNHTPYEIAKMLNYSNTTVYNILRYPIHNMSDPGIQVRPNIRIVKKVEPKICAKPKPIICAAQLITEELPKMLKLEPEPLVKEDQNINELLSHKIDKLLKRILVNPEIYYETINLANSEFSSIQEKSENMSQQEINGIAIHRTFVILQKIMILTPKEKEKIFLKLVGV
jgi:transposase